MTDTVTLTGLVATTPRHIVTSANLSITSFRLASNQRRFDRATNSWVDTDTNWYTVATFRQLASNTLSSIHKGDRIVVTGRLRIREWENGERKGTNVEVEADAIGHDLRWGTSSYIRSLGVASKSQEDFQTSSASQEIAASYDSAEHANGDSGPFDPDEGEPNVAAEAALSYSAPLRA